MKLKMENIQLYDFQIAETKNFETVAVLIQRMALTMDLKGGVFTKTIFFSITLF